MKQERSKSGFEFAPPVLIAHPKSEKLAMVTKIRPRPRGGFGKVGV